MRFLTATILLLLPTLTSACALKDTTTKNDWLANAPAYAQDAGSDDAPSDLADVGGTSHDHSHSGHR
jgi:hypothetical protein